RQHALSFIGALICAVCASLSLGNGILIWGILVVMLWVNKNRHLWRYIAIVLCGGIFVFITLRGGLDITGNQYQRLQLSDIPNMIHIWLLMHSRPFLADIYYQLIPDTPQTVYFAVSQTTAFSLLPALIGFGLLGYTAWRIFRRDGMQALVIPIGMGLYASGALGMIAVITPLQTMTDHSDKLVLALTERYLYVAVIFWLTLMSLIALYWRDAQRQYKMVVSLILIIFIGLHLHTLMREIPYISFNELAFPLDDPLQNEQCAEMYILTGDRTCIYASWMTDWDRLDQLASRRLAGYADLPIRTLAPYFLQDDILILNSESAWQSIHLRDFFFDDIPQQAIIHIAPNTSDVILADIAHSPNPPAHLLLGHDEQNNFSALLTNTSGVWYVIRPPLYQGEALPHYRTTLETQFVPAHHIITPENIQLTRYIRPFETSDRATFGDDIRLAGYQFIGDTDFEACDTVILQTAWITDTIQNQTIQLSLALTDDPITRAITNTDSALSPIPIQFWDMDKPYYDERYLTVPCDLPSGNYLLILTLYPITDEGDILPNLSVTDTELRVDGHLLGIEEVIIR
ncbi:MAG: hypothetical protein KJ043_09760, partial [Anaerolineae bacterium]|nr:hypothetical protein [Anaerolineae bacterium]